MRQIEWATPNRMVIDTGLAVFDRQVGALGIGNRIGPCQLSAHIRPYDLTDFGGRPWDPGALQASDLRPFEDLLDAPMRAAIARECTSEPAILYAFFHHTRANARIVHGTLLTRCSDNGYRELARSASPRKGSARVLAVCAEFVSQPQVPAGREATLRSAFARRSAAGAS